MGEGLVNAMDKILAAMAKMFAQEGRTREVAILAHSESRIEQTAYDNWDGGTYGYTVCLQLAPHHYAQLTDQQVEIEKVFCQKAVNLTRTYPNESIDAFMLTTELVEDPTWRDRAKQWISGKGVSNQGRARSDNVAPLMSDGLLFPSPPEILLYKALKSLGITFAPLPVFVRGGLKYRRLEPDFVILKDGILMIVEVDGDTVHQETPHEAHDRLTMLQHEGAYIERVNAKECNTPEKAQVCAARILETIEKHKANR